MVPSRRRGGGPTASQAGNGPLSEAGANLPPGRVVTMVKASGPATADLLAEQSDEQLMGRYREQARTEDFNELVRRYERELYRYLARYTGDRALADDVFQNTFLQLHLKRGLYEEGRPVRPWLYAI